METREKAYEYAGKYFVHILEDFQIQLDEATKETVYLFFELIESLDAYIDSLQGEKRQKTIASILAFIGGSVHVLGKDLPQKIKNGLMQLRSQLRSPEKTREVLEKIFANNVIVQTSKDIHAFIAATLEEGSLTADLILNEIPHVDKATKDFVRRLSATGNLADNILDAREDYKAGEIAIQPNISFFRQTIKKIVPESIRLFIQYPNKARIRYFGKRVLQEYMVSNF